LALAVTAALSVVFSTAALAQEAEGSDVVQTFQKGVTLYKTGEFTAAREAFEDVLARQPGMQAALRMRDAADLAELAEMVGNEEVGPQVRELLMLLRRAGEERKRTVENVEEILADFQSPEAVAYRRGAVMLTGHGPHAVPHVVGLLALEKPEDQRTVARAVSLLSNLHRDACLPLVRALRNADDSLLRVRVAGVLAQIGDERAIPALLATAGDAAAPADLREAARQAVATIAEETQDPGTPAEAYALLADAYTCERTGLVGYTYGLTADIWQWNPEGEDLPGRIVCEEVPNYLYYQRMATETALEGLAAAPDDAGLQALLAASLSRQTALCDYFASGDVDLTGAPTDEATRQDAAERLAEFQAEVPVALRMLKAPVLAEALKKTIAANDGAAALLLVRTLGDKLAASGPASLCPAGAEALSAALASGDKDVRYNATVVVVAASPDAEQVEPGDVIDVMGAALQAAAERTALVAMDNFQLRNKLATVLRGEGLATSEAGAMVPQIQAVLALEPAVDVVFLSANVDAGRFASLLQTLRADVRTKGAPLYVVCDPGADSADLTKVEGLAGILSPDDLRQAKLAPIADQVKAESRSAFTEEEATLVLRAAKALAGVDPLNTAYPLLEAQPALVMALAGYGDEVTAAGICALSRFGDAGCLDGLAAVVAGQGALELKVAAARALAAVLSRSEEAAPADIVDVLMGALQSDEQCLREAAAEALGQAGLPADTLLSVLRTQGLGLAE